MLFQPLESRILCSAALAGDANGDGYVNIADDAVIANNWGHKGGAGDVNGDGIVDIADMVTVANNWDHTIYDGHTATINGILNVWMPNPVDFGSTWAPDMTNPTATLYGPTGSPNIEAVEQGQVSDCYLLAAIGSMAISHPNVVDNIAYDGTGWVSEWFNENTGVPLVIHTSNQFSTYYQAQTGEVWWEVLEKEFAFFRTWNGKSSLNTIASLNFGFEQDVWADLGQKPATALPYANVDLSVTAAAIAAALAAHKPITFDTNLAAQDGLVQNHVYVVTAVSGDTFTLYNPWGFYDTRDLLTLEANGLGFFELGL